MAFQGVVCYGFNSSNSKLIQDILDIKVSSVHHGIDCLELELDNKYYQTKVHLFEYQNLPEDRRTDVLRECHAIILNGTGLGDLSMDESAKLLEQVGGEPRLLLCDRDDSLRDWSIKNGYDLLDTGDEDIRGQMIDSLSAYKWPHRLDKDERQKQLDEETIKKLMDFDYLLDRVKTCRDDPDDKKIHEIGQLLSGLLGDDIDSFLNDDEGGDANDDDDDDDDLHETLDHAKE